MKIQRLNMNCEGHVFCHSVFYSSHDILDGKTMYTLSTGVNRLYGEIDSGGWAVSCLLSMYDYAPDDFILYQDPCISINGIPGTLTEILPYSCYMDKSYPLFASNASIKALVSKGLANNHMNYSPSDIRNMFCIDLERFERPLSCVGNEVFKGMAAIGYCHGKNLFCFPWLSARRRESFHQHLSFTLDVLSSLKQMVIFPAAATHEET